MSVVYVLAQLVSDRGIDSDFPVFGLMIEPLFHISCRWKSVHFSVSSIPDILLLAYQHLIDDQQDSIEMRYEDENIWLTQKMMATLYDVGLPTINEHIKKIYADSELEESATIRNFRIVQTEGSRQVTRDTKHYNLQMIVAVGFNVNNERAVQFRKWANDIVKDYTIKGFVQTETKAG